jgi:hypothetical protein
MFRERRIEINNFMKENKALSLMKPDASGPSQATGLSRYNLPYFPNIFLGFWRNIILY